MLSADGLLMPTLKGQPPPDLHYFKQNGVGSGWSFREWLVTKAPCLKNKSRSLPTGGPGGRGIEWWAAHKSGMLPNKSPAKTDVAATQTISSLCALSFLQLCVLRIEHPVQLFAGPQATPDFRLFRLRREPRLALLPVGLAKRVR